MDYAAVERARERREAAAQTRTQPGDDEGTGEALIESLRKGSENTPEGERGPGTPGLN